MFFDVNLKKQSVCDSEEWTTTLGTMKKNKTKQKILCVVMLTIKSPFWKKRWWMSEERKLDTHTYCYYYYYLKCIYKVYWHWDDWTQELWMRVDAILWNVCER